MTNIDQYRSGHTDTEIVRIMIVEDHPLFGQGLRRVLEGEDDLRVIAEVDDGALSVERALELLSAAPAKRGSAKSVLKDLGTHPQDGDPVQVLSGRYGPYVNHKKVNATLPKEQKPEDVTLEQALAMLAQKKDAPAKKVVRRRAG